MCEGKRLRRGVFFGLFDALSSPQAAAEVAIAAEAAGWDGVFVWDHLLYGQSTTCIADPWVCLAAIACATSSVVLGPMVTPLPRRRPQVVARQAVTLDRLAGGRLVLGFGSGGDDRRELSAFGEAAARSGRGAMLSEGLRVLTELMGGEEVAYRGAHYQADRVRFLPRPGRETGIPIWLGAKWPNRPPVRRAARYDGVFPAGLSKPDDLKTIRTWIAAEGGGLDFEYVVYGSSDADVEPWERAGATWFLTQLDPFTTSLEAILAIVTAGPT